MVVQVRSSTSDNLFTHKSFDPKLILSENKCRDGAETKGKANLITGPTQSLCQGQALIPDINNDKRRAGTLVEEIEKGSKALKKMGTSQKPKKVNKP